VVSTLLLCY